MYEQFKNNFIANLNSTNINLNTEQIDKILLSMDTTVQNYDIYQKSESNVEIQNRNNGIPKVVYTYIACKQAEGLDYKTIYTYKIFLEIFFNIIKKSPDQVNAADIRVFLHNYQTSSNVTNRTLNKYREYLLRFFTWLHDNGMIPINVSKQVKPIHYEEIPRQFLTQYELEKLRNACKTIRDFAVIDTLYSTGCRVSELINMKFSDIDWYSGTVHIVGKGKKHRISFLNARAKLSLENYINNDRKGESEYIFVSSRSPFNNLTKESIEKIVKEIDTRAELDKHVTPHVIRHTTATIALNNGMLINELSTLLGHSNIETTMIYARTSYDSVQRSHAKYVI